MFRIPRTWSYFVVFEFPTTDGGTDRGNAFVELGWRISDEGGVRFVQEELLPHVVGRSVMITGFKLLRFRPFRKPGPLIDPQINIL